MAEKTIEELTAEIEALKAENEKQKTAQSRASAEAAEYKRQLQAKMTDDEKRKAAEEEEKAARDKEIADIKAHNAALEKEICESHNQASLLALGFSAERAKSTAEALGGNRLSPELLKSLGEHIAEHDKEIAAKEVNGTPPPAAGNGSKGITKEDFKKMSYSEMVKLQSENPELYNELTK